MFKLIFSLVLLNLFIYGECRNRVTLYPSIGDTVRLQCVSGGQFFCYSTYTLQNVSHPMVMLNSSMKYQVGMGSLAINNVEATDAGYYTCAVSCSLLKSDQIDYYVHPVSNQMPIDVSQIFLAIPPFIGYDTNGGIGAADQESNQYPVYPPNYFQRSRSGLNDGEIAGIVIGCVSFVIIVVAVIAFLAVCSRRRNQNNPNKPNTKNNKKTNNNQQAPDGTAVDYSTIERDYGLKGDTVKSDKTLIRDDHNEHQHQQQNLPNVDILGRNGQPRPGLDNQARRNYEIADRIANQFQYENQQQSGQPQQSVVAQKQPSGRFDNQFGGLDGPAQPKGQNLYGTNGVPPVRPPVVGPVAGGYELPSKLPSNRGGEEQPSQKTPTRNRIDFPKPNQQLPQVLPQLVRGPSGSSRQYQDENPPLLDPRYDDENDETRRQEAFRGKTDGKIGTFSRTNGQSASLIDYEGTAEERRGLALPDPVEYQPQQQQNVPFKSLIKAQKASRSDLQQDIPQQQQQQQAPTNRSYQGNLVQPQLQQQQQQIPRPQQLPPRQPPPPSMYEKRSDSMQAQMDVGAPVKDNATDV